MTRSIFILAACCMTAIQAAPAQSADVADIIADNNITADNTDDNATRYTFRYQFRPGETIRWQVVHRKKVDTTVSGIGQATETFSKSVKVWRVEDVMADGTVSFEQRVEDVDMWQQMGDAEQVRYNSQTDETPPPGYEDLAKSLDVGLAIITLDPRGQVVKRDRKSVKAATQSNGQLTIPFPEEPIAVGHVWSMPYTIETQTKTGRVKKINTRQQYTLRSVKTGVAVIEVATQILTPIDDPAIEAQLMQCESRGTVRFDVEAGRILSQKMDVDRKVVGYPNEVSSFHYVTRFTEELMPSDRETASR